MDKEPLLPITVRFKAAAWNVIREIAEETGVSQAEVVRMAVAGNMARYLGDVRYIDQEQAKEIKQLVTELLDVTSAVRNELHWIGVNHDHRGLLVNLDLKRYAVIERECRHACVDDRTYSPEEFAGEVYEGWRSSGS